MIKKNKSSVRVRFAPSPTGPLHIGTVRSALYNYLFAKKYGGFFILRIEDTDLERSVEKYTKDIINSLLWLGIKWDEGPLPNGKEKGSFGPYRQTLRTVIYEKYINELVQKKILYRCYCTKEELEQEKKTAEKAGHPPVYSQKCRDLSDQEIKKLKNSGRNSILRFKTPSQTISFEDAIRGKVTFESALLGDFSVARDEKTPLYNLAAVIDDYTMKITHVIRGEDHLSNTPKQILLQKALRFPSPQYTHLPLILNEDRTKLSKRHNKVSVNDYREEGYLPEAMLNFFALLGWNPKTTQEIFSKKELIKKFSLENIHKGGAVFNKKRLDWLNGYYLRKLKARDYYQAALPYLKKASFNLDHKKYIENVITLEQERIRKLSDLPDMIRFFFNKELKYDPELLIWKKKSRNEIKANLEKAAEFFKAMPEKDYQIKLIEKGLKTLIERDQLDIGSILWPLRVALTGCKASPGPFEVAAVLGKERVINRLNKAISLIS